MHISLGLGGHRPVPRVSALEEESTSLLAGPESKRRGHTRPNVVLYLLWTTAGFMLATGIVAGVVGGAYNDSPRHTLACGIAAAVNLIACTAYVRLAMNRARPLSADLTHATRDLWGAAIRSIDWTITFPLMQLEICAMGDNLSAFNTSLPETWVMWMAALLAFVTIACDAVARVGVPLSRSSKLKTCGCDVIVFITLQCISVAAFVVLFGVYLNYSVQSPPPVFKKGSTSGTLTFVYLWWVYPAISISLDVLSVLQSNGPSTVGLWRDVLFSIADVVSKGILALYVATATVNAGK